jgi:hypothetical protein
MVAVAIREVLEGSNALQTRRNFDNVYVNGKPSAETEGLILKTSDLAKSDMGSTNNPILSETPNLYKQNGVPMSKIPFSFTAIPEYFFTSGWLSFDNPEKFTKRMMFLHWAFKKCSIGPKKVPFDGRMVELGPYEFIYGRNKSAAECGLTCEELRHQLNAHRNAKFIEKAPNSAPNRFTVYRWVTEAFYENNPQLNPPLNPQLNPQLNPHKSYDRLKKRDKIDHPSIPSFEKKGQDDLIDDLSLKENKNLVHKGKYHNGMPFEVYLSQQELDECMVAKGGLERIKEIIDRVAGWPGRKYEIKEWKKTILGWNIKNSMGDRIADNEKLGKTIEELYGDSPGWRARVYRDNLKDQRGVLFEGQGAYMVPIFVSFSEPQFKEKCKELINTKKMKKKGEK